MIGYFPKQTPEHALRHMLAAVLAVNVHVLLVDWTLGRIFLPPATHYAAMSAAATLTAFEPAVALLVVHYFAGGPTIHPLRRAAWFTLALAGLKGELVPQFSIEALFPGSTTAPASWPSELGSQLAIWIAYYFLIVCVTVLAPMQPNGEPSRTLSTAECTGAPPPRPGRFVLAQLIVSLTIATVVAILVQSAAMDWANGQPLLTLATYLAGTPAPAYLGMGQRIVAVIALYYYLGQALPRNAWQRAGILALVMLALTGDVLRQPAMNALLASSAGTTAPWTNAILNQADVWATHLAAALCIALLAPFRPSAKFVCER